VQVARRPRVEPTHVVVSQAPRVARGASERAARELDAVDRAAEGAEVRLLPLLRGHRAGRVQRRVNHEGVGAARVGRQQVSERRGAALLEAPELHVLASADEHAELLDGEPAGRGAVVAHERVHGADDRRRRVPHALPRARFQGSGAAELRLAQLRRVVAAVLHDGGRRARRGWDLGGDGRACDRQGGAGARL